MEISLVEKPGFVKVSNTDFASRCTICGGNFEVDSLICPNKHYYGQVYWINSKDLPEAEKVNKRKVKEGAIACRAFGSRCNICGAYIPEGDDVCSNAHQIGKLYLVK